MIWGEGKKGRLFLPGRNDSEAAAKEASQCARFTPDYEEECMAAEEVSCFNCRYRRWTSDSFECMKGGLDK